MTAWDRFSQAALDFARFDLVILGLKRSVRKCSEYSVGNSYDGAGSSAPCDLSPEGDGARCGNCQARLESGDAYRAALRGRQLAKRRMTKWFPKLDPTWSGAAISVSNDGGKTYSPAILPSDPAIQNPASGDRINAE